ncbi:MAG: HD domain-containing protein [Saprospiraceae bacterium]|nr:HD domain-containing protein [Saprospiraceae bacterium]
MSTQIYSNALLESVADHVRTFLEEKLSPDYVFHDLPHTEHVVESAQEIALGLQLTDEELEIILIAAWFHDVGYIDGPQNHEERGCAEARKFLSGKKYPEEKIKQVEACILATRFPQKPENLLEKVICDSDLSHLGKLIYWDRCGRIRQEMLLTRDRNMDDKEWVEFELNFMRQHAYHTEVAKALYGNEKAKHIKQLKKQRKRLDPDRALKKKKNAQRSLDSNLDTELKQIRLGRGVETMYRSTYRTHVNLSSIADNKANIMLSINAIIISIVVSTLVPGFGENPKLIIPTILLLSVCLIAVVFATLSTRPKVTEGKFTREDIEQKRSNLLFFGNYYNMELEDFHWGMMEMIKDDDFLYSSMTRDLYYLGKVLAKKYQYLSICYAIFMYGLIGAVVAFAIAFAL